MNIHSKEMLMAIENKVTLTVTTTPSDATCVLTYEGVNYTTKTLEVKKGSTVSYTVSKTGYGTQTGSWVIDSDVTKSVTITINYYTFAINTTPSDAYCLMTYGTYSGNTKSVNVPYGTEVSYSVYRTGYAEQTGSQVVTSDITKSITLTKNNYTLTVTTTPSDATCTLVGNGTTTTNKSITVPYDTSVSYTISAANYTTQTGSWTVTSNTTKSVTLALVNRTLTVNTTPSDATCQLTYGGNTYTSKTATVPHGTTVSYEVSATNYTTQTGSWTITSDETKSVTLSLTTHSLTVTTTPSSATCKLKYSTSSTWTTTKSLSNIPYGTVIDYEVSATNYTTKSGSWTITADTSKSVSLSLKTYAFTVYSKDTSNNNLSANITIGSSTSNNVTSKTSYISHGSSANYSVSKTNYQTQSGNSGTMTAAKSVTVNLKAMVTLTVNPTPSDATVTLTATGYTQSGKTITVPEGTSVSYTVSKSGYVTQSGSWTISSTVTKTVTLTALYTLTVNPTPSDATVTLTASGYTQSGNTITVPSGTSVSYSVSKTNYVTQSGSWTVTSTTTKTVTLSLVQYTLTVTTTPSNATCVLTYGGNSYTSKTATVDYGTTVSYSVSATGYTTQTGSWTITSATTKSITLEAVEYDWIQPTLSANGTVGEDSFAVSTNHEGTNKLWKAFDGSTSTLASFSGTGTSNLPVDIVMYNPTGLKVSAISFTNRNSTNYAPQAGAIYGSNDGSTYTTLVSSISPDQTSGATWTVSVNSSQYYKYHKASFTQWTAGSSGRQIKEIVITAKVQGSI